MISKILEVLGILFVLSFFGVSLVGCSMMTKGAGATRLSVGTNLVIDFSQTVEEQSKGLEKSIATTVDDRIIDAVVDGKNADPEPEPQPDDG